ncbi:MAG: YqiA/YcfP family alpha/beta fold hydrolase, partial [Promethearchaeota archaeon]
SELLFQLSFYSSLRLDWIIIISIYGLVCGSYKYRPLIYKNPRKILNTIFILIISSLITFLAIILFQFILNIGIINFYVVLINYGVKFLIQALISVVLFIPIFLYIYDWYLAKEERYVYSIILTHHPISASDHTFYLKFGRTKVYFCSRCSGVIIGGIIALFLFRLIDLIFSISISPEIALILVICIPIPGLIDWGTQRLLLRKSTTSSRLLTGFVIGIGLNLINFTYKYYFITITIIAVYFSILFLLMLFGYRKELKKFREDLNSGSYMRDYNVIFIHGLESSGKSFKAQYLKSIFPNILTPDFKMYNSKQSLKSILYERMMQLNTILEEQNNWIIIGSSFGGLMGALYALQNPEKVERLILFAPFLAIEELIDLKLEPIRIPVIVYHGKNDEVVPLDQVMTKAKKLFLNLEYNIVDDNHYLHSTFRKINWKEFFI